MTPTNSAPIRRLWLFILCALAASPAQAADFCSDSTICVVPLKKGVSAPFSGELMTQDLAIQLSQQEADCQERVDAAIEREQGFATANIKQEKTLHAVDVKNLTAQLMQLQSQLATAEKIVQEDGPPFFLHPGFVGPVAFAIGVAATVWVASTAHK